MNKVICVIGVLAFALVAGILAMDSRIVAAAAGAPETRSPFTGDCRVRLSLKGDVLEAQLAAEKDVEGVLMVTYVVAHEDPIVACQKFVVSKQVSVTKRVPLNWENHGVWLYRVELFESGPDENVLLPVGSVLVERKKTD
ncbi:MAG TPA: hypothetical protein VMZ92_12080 [Planctomycetota bacterium]|nr:hypothetical protein [Planctomycetota bacterium]